jgi:hypothetical protein
MQKCSFARSKNLDFVKNTKQRSKNLENLAFAKQKLGKIAFNFTKFFLVFKLKKWT